MATPVTVSVPGSKSYTNRALVLAAITRRPVRISRPLASEDTRAMLGCLRALGIAVRETNAELWEVTGNVSDVTPGDYDLNANQSGTTIRFLLALCCVIPGIQTIGGQPSLNKRPIRELVDGLRALGADIEYLGQDGYPPLRIKSTTLASGTVSMPGDISSQYFSALLQIAPLIDGELIVCVTGNQISKPYIDMTIDTMRQFSVAVTNDSYNSYTVAAGQHYAATSYAVEGDLSSAAYFFAIAALTRTTIIVQNVNPRSAQADLHFVEQLQGMGNVVRSGTQSITIEGRGVKAGTYDMEDCPDQAMTMAVLAAFAGGTTLLTGVQSLRIKETERVVAVEQELAKMGIRTKSTPDTLTIYGGRPRAAHIDTYGDHRIAMSFAVATTIVPEIEINNPEVVAKTFPDFWDKLHSVTKTNIVLIGMRGTGKTTIGKMLAGRLGKTFVDMDEQVVAAAGMPISKIVEQHGWDYFRDIESALAARLGAVGNTVIASGGGVVLRPQNVEALGRRGTFVLLTAPIEELVIRIGGDSERPSLTAKTNLQAELTELWAAREGIYRTTAQHVIGSAKRTPSAITSSITKSLKIKL